MLLNNDKKNFAEELLHMTTDFAGTGITIDLYLTMRESFLSCVLSSVFIYLGGHTTEMLKLVAELSSHYQPRHYVVADTDTMSIDKLNAMEKNRTQHGGDDLVCFIC